MYELDASFGYFDVDYFTFHHPYESILWDYTRVVEHPYHDASCLVFEAEKERYKLRTTTLFACLTNFNMNGWALLNDLQK